MVEAEDLALQLADLIRNSGDIPDLVVGIANGGVHPAYHVARALDRPLLVYRVFRASGQLKERFAFARAALFWKFSRSLVRSIAKFVDRRLTKLTSGPDTLQDHVRQKRVLAVDDCVDSGATMALVRSTLQERGAVEVRTAALCWTSRSHSAEAYGLTPDYFLQRRLDSYPWSADNQEFPVFRLWLREFL
jgi:hypoxanthine phosphoribosyltransferase